MDMALVWADLDLGADFGRHLQRCERVSLAYICRLEVIQVLLLVRIPCALAQVAWLDDPGPMARRFAHDELGRAQDVVARTESRTAHDSLLY